MPDPPRSRVEWPHAPGEMAQRIRAHDWAATPLGPIPAWPERLRHAVELVLAMPYAAAVSWGPDLLQIYNDRTIASYGHRHPAALGRPLFENLAEAAEPLRAAGERLFATGEAFAYEDRAFVMPGPDGQAATRWFTGGWTPIKDEDGRVLGILASGLDTTERAQVQVRLREGEERQAFLLALSDALRPLADPVAVQEAAGRLLAERIGLDRCGYCEVDETGDAFTVHRDVRAPGMPSFAGRHRIGAFGRAIGAALRRGETIAIGDAARDPNVPPEALGAWRGAQVAASAAVPLIKEGRLAAILFGHRREPRPWTREEIALIAETAERTWAAAERARFEAVLRESEDRSRVILESALDYAIFSMDAQGRIETWPGGAEAVFGWAAEEVIGRHAAITFVPEDRESGAVEQEMAEARENGVAPNVRWHLRKDGRRVFIEGSMRLLRDGGPGPHGYLKIGQDVTERRHWEQRQGVLLAELQHRTRNLMGVVRAMFDRTRRGSASIEALSAAYKDRLAALARVQGLLSRLSEGDRVSFDELIRTELSAMGAVDARGQGERVSLDGPRDVRLRSSTVQTFALALHELATNASKYGALAQPGGRLSVRWRLLRSSKGPRLRIAWVESGVAMPEPDAVRTGYGRELIERALPYQLRAETRYELGPDGVRCTIEMPVSESTRVEEDESA